MHNKQSIDFLFLQSLSTGKPNVYRYSFFNTFFIFYFLIFDIDILLTPYCSIYYC